MSICSQVTISFRYPILRGRRLKKFLKRSRLGEVRGLTPPVSSGDRAAITEETFGPILSARSATVHQVIARFEWQLAIQAIPQFRLTVPRHSQRTAPANKLCTLGFRLP